MPQQPITTIPSRSLVRAGQVANQAAARVAFDEYRANPPAQTLRAQQIGARLWTQEWPQP